MATTVAGRFVASVRAADGVSKRGTSTGLKATLRTAFVDRTAFVAAGRRFDVVLDDVERELGRRIELGAFFSRMIGRGSWKRPPLDDPVVVAVCGIIVNSMAKNWRRNVDPLFKSLETSLLLGIPIMKSRSSLRK